MIDYQYMHKKWTPKEWSAFCRKRIDKWVPAAMGTSERFISRDGITMLYVFNPAIGHAYLNCDTNKIMSHSLARKAMGLS